MEASRVPEQVYKTKGKDSPTGFPVDIKRRWFTNPKGMALCVRLLRAQQSGILYPSGNLTVKCSQKLQVSDDVGLVKVTFLVDQHNGQYLLHAWRDPVSSKFICLQFEFGNRLWFSKSFYDRLMTKRGDLYRYAADKQTSRKPLRLVACKLLLGILDSAGVMAADSHHKLQTYATTQLELLQKHSGCSSTALAYAFHASRSCELMSCMS